MKEKTSLFMIGVLILLVTQCLSSAPCFAEVEWTTTRQLDLEQSPIDVATSSDGAMIFILSPGEILVYTIAKSEITDRIPVDKSFDRLTYSSKDNSLILSSSLDRAIEIIRIETIHDISVTGLPYLGTEDAPVTIAVFNDYQ